MIVADLITMRQAASRERRGLPVYGLILGYNSIVWLNLSRRRLWLAFTQRFPVREDGISFSSRIREIDSSRPVSLDKGKYLVADLPLVEYKSVARLYRQFGRTEEDYVQAVFS